MELKRIESEFETSPSGAFRSRWGAGRTDGVFFAQKKLCFVATDQAFLASLLLDLSRRSDCYFVKYTRQARDGMFLGRCFLLDERSVGELWRALKHHPKLMCTIQDDEFTMPFRTAGGASDRNPRLWQD